MDFVVFPSVIFWKSPIKTVDNPKLRFAHVFDKKETMFDKMTAGVVGKLTKSIVTKFVSGIEKNQSNPLGKNPWRGAAMLIVDQEIPIQPISKKNTNGKKHRQSYEGTFQIRASLAGDRSSVFSYLRCARDFSS